MSYVKNVVLHYSKPLEAMNDETQPLDCLLVTGVETMTVVSVTARSTQLWWLSGVHEPPKECETNIVML